MTTVGWPLAPLTQASALLLLARSRRQRPARYLVCALASAGLLLCGASSTVAQTNTAVASSQPISSIDPSPRVMIAKSAHLLANAMNDAGPVEGAAPMDRMVLVLGMTAEQEQQLHTLLDSQQTKGSPDFHHWLTPEEFGNRFGPTPDDLHQAQAWLEQQGFRVGTTARSKRWIEFSGTAGQVEAAFQTQIRRYQVRGEVHTANATDISIPAHLSGVVRGLLSLHDFTSKPMLANHYEVHRNAAGVFVPTDPNYTVSGQKGVTHFLTPSDYTTIYNLAPLSQEGLDGTGQTIAIVARSNIYLADVEVFRQAFGLPSNDPNVILSGPDPGFVGNDALEASLDVEWAGAIAPKATIDLVVSASTTTTDGVALSAAYIVDNNLAGTMSVSFGQCEQSLGTAGNAFYNGLWQQAAAEGISVLVAAGDNGAAGCDDPSDPNNQPAQGGVAVNGLASTPFDTAVGGTEFNENGNDATFWNSANGAAFTSAVGYIPEAVWNESCNPNVSTLCTNNSFNLYAGSGGASSVYAKPSWQTGLNVPADGQRDLPDVSLAAAAGHDGYLMCYVGSCLTTPDDNILVQAIVVGGTSASAPSLAGMLALINQKTGSRQGLANYILYPLAAKESLPNCNSSNQTNPSATLACVFNDITAGNNAVPGAGGYGAATGFDLATGLGSVNAANLVNAWGSVTFQGSTTTFSAPSAAISHGQPVQVTVNVSAASGSGVPSGSFALMTDKYGSAGVGTLTDGSFTGTFSSLPGGQYNLTAHYQGDGTFGSSDSTPVAVNISPENSAITLQADTFSSTGPLPISSSSLGNFVYLHSAVTSLSGDGTATGTVTYQDGSTTLGSIALNSRGESELVSGGFSSLGAAICLPVGTHTITASYSGDNSLNSSVTAQPLFFTVTKGTAFLNISASQTAIAATQQVLFHAFIGGSAGTIPPTGTVQFMDGSAPLGSPISITTPPPGANPQVDLQALLSVGSHSISASYSGDGNYGSASALTPVPVTVTAASGSPTQTVLTTGSSSPTVGQVVNYTVSVSGSQSTPVPTGTVQLMNGELGPLAAAVTLSNGYATIPIQWTFGGSQSLSAQYSGDSNFAASASTPILVTVKPATPSITLSASSPTLNSGSQVSLTATVATSIRPISGALVGLGGEIQFFDALNGGASQPISSPVVLIPVTTDPVVTGWWNFVAASTLPVLLKDGNHVILAEYLGNGSYGSVTSSPVSISVGTRRNSQTTLIVDYNSPTFGQTLNFTATVTPAQGSPAPTGSVQFISPSLGIVGTSSLQNGSAMLSVPWSTGGFQTVAAQYSGDTNYASSQSSPVTISLPSFEFTAGDNQLAIPAGGNAGVFLLITPLAGLHATVVLNCGTGIPAGSKCTISPSTVNLDGVTPATPSLVLTTTSPSTNALKAAQRSAHVWSGFGATVVLTALGLILLPAGMKKRSKYLLSLMIIGTIAGVIACGGGGGVSDGGGGGGGGGVLAQTSTSVASSGTKSAGGSPVTFTATVTTSAKTITGNMTFFDGTTQLGQPVIVSNGQAQLQSNSLSVGTHMITAQYSGDSLNKQSVSSPLAQVITGSGQFQVTAAAGLQVRTITMNVLIE